MAMNGAFAHCLIVDDSSVVRKVAARILSNQVARISEAANGRTALDFCTREMPDLIILDADLPDMLTVDIVTQIREMRGGRGVHIVLCLFKLDVPRIMRARRAGIDGHILKPFDRSYLLEHITSWTRAA